MNYAQIDIKIKSLIQICKETENFKKLSVVSFILTSNLLNEIGVKLGIRPRNLKSDEKIFEYMKIINEVIEDNLKVSLFNEKDIDSIREIEGVFLLKRGDIPLRFIKKMFSIYYELRKIDVPNLHENTNQDEFPLTTSFNLNSNNSFKKNNDNNKFTPLILHKIREKELIIQKDLKKAFNKESFEAAIYLKKFKDSLANRGSNKIKLQGQLKDSIRYQRALDGIIGHVFIGFSIIFMMLGLVIVIETMIYPDLTVIFSVFILMFFGPVLLLFLIYWYYFKKEG